MNTLLRLPPHVRQKLASGLESGLIACDCTAAAVRSILGQSEGTELVPEVLREFARLDLSGKASAAWIRSMEEVAAEVPRPDLVWSGEEVPGLHARKTRHVYEELLGSAQRSIWASTYAFFEGKKAFDVLAQRMDEVPELRVTLMLNIQRKWGDKTAPESLVRKFAERFWATEWPGASRPKVFYDPRSLELGSATGVLHAKAVVCDDESVFVTSANLTEAAFDRNIELGLLLRDRAMAASLVRHFATLIEKKLLSPLPMA